jgi:hypothetical protein
VEVVLADLEVDGGSLFGGRLRTRPGTLGPACLGYFFVLLDVTIVNVSLADMGVISDG